MIIPNFGYGGAQRVFRDLSLELSVHCEVIECVFNLDERHIHKTGNPLISLNVPGGKNWVSKVYNFIRRVRRLRSIKRSEKIDISISHLEGADYVNILSHIKEEKLLLCIHGSKRYDVAISGTLGWFRKKILIPFLYPKADAIVTVAEGIRKELIQYFRLPERILYTINNGFDIDRIRLQSNETVPENLQCAFSRPALVAHGRLANEKNLQLLLQVAASPVLINKVNVIIIGDGAEYESLILKARALGLLSFVFDRDHTPAKDCQIYFLGFQRNPFAFLRRSTLFIFPSLYEGFPLALVEAMICGVPVISRDCYYGPKEILMGDSETNNDVTRGQYGVLISKDAPLESWILAINHLLSDNSLMEEYKMKMDSRVQDFSSRRFRSNWFTLINQVLHGR